MDLRRHWLGLALLIIVGVTYTWATWRFFTQVVPGGNDFLAHYTAWEAFFGLGYSPYSDKAALYTQQAIYGRAALPGEDQNRLTYPFYSFLVHAPFIWIDYALARAIYMTLLQAALLAGVVMIVRLVRWRQPVWLAGVTMAWAMLYYPEARGIILGQFAIFGFFSLAGSLYLLSRKHDLSAGLLLVLSTVKPTLVFLVIPYLLFWAVVRRRWRFIAGFFALLGVLVTASFIMQPSWLHEWVNRMTLYSDYTVGQSPVWLLTRVAFPALGGVGELTISLGLITGMLWTWRLALRPGGAAAFYWALGVTLVVSNLIVSRSATTNYVLLLPPALWVFAALDRWKPLGRYVLLAAMLVSFIGLWWLHFATVVGNQEQPVMFIPMPVILGLALLLGQCWLSRDAEEMGIAL